jgi:hypothetical protein
MQKYFISSVVTLAAFFLIPFSAHSAIIFNSGSPDFSGNGGADIGGSNLFVEQFTLGSAETIDSVQVGLSLYTFVPSWDGSISYYLYNDSGDLPSTLIQQGSNPAFNMNSLGVPYPFTGSYDYNYQFNLLTPVTLSAGSYWLGVQTTTSSNLEWVDVNQTQVNGAVNVGGDFYPVEETLSLQLSNTSLVASPASAPEPGTGALVLLSGIGLATIRRRKKKTSE